MTDQEELQQCVYAAHRLLHTLAMVGLDRDKLEYRVNEHGESVVAYTAFGDASTITVTVSHFWAHPNTPCYFVNHSHKDGDFTYCSGTPMLERALMDLGMVIERADQKALKQASCTAEG